MADKPSAQAVCPPRKTLFRGGGACGEATCVRNQAISLSLRPLSFLKKHLREQLKTLPIFYFLFLT
jgi:hypothetical protein